MTFILPTPLGPLRIKLACNAGHAPLASEPLTAPAVAAWALGSNRAILCVRPIAPELVPPHAVERTLRLTLRLGGAAATPATTVRIELVGGTAFGGPAYGQSLAAFTWTKNGVELSLGTQDDEYLAYIAECGTLIPARLAPTLRNDSPVRRLASGFEIRMPPLAPAETVILCFAVAWAPATPANEDATWFAVDLGTAAGP